jgi:hypothetical protein
MMIKACLLAVLLGLGFGQQQQKGRQPIQNGPNFARQQNVQRAQTQKKPANAVRQGPNALNAVSQVNLAGKRPAAVQGRGCRCSSSSSSSCFQPPPNPCHGECNRINVIPDAGFYSFSYAGSNTFSPRSFYICTDKTLFLSVTNCFLQGDYFEVFDNGQPILITDEGNNFPGFPSGNVTEPVNDPSTCLASLDFNHGWAVLNPGTHLLTVLVGASWYSGGAGFLRVDTACLIAGQMQPCCMGDGQNGASCPQFIVA